MPSPNRDFILCWSFEQKGASLLVQYSPQNLASVTGWGIEKMLMSYPCQRTESWLRAGQRESPVLMVIPVWMMKFPSHWVGRREGIGQKVDTCIDFSCSYQNKMFLNKYFSIYCLFIGQFPEILNDYFSPFSTISCWESNSLSSSRNMLEVLCELIKRYTR